MLSLIVPSLNMSCLIREALGSVAAQTFSDFEVLCVDAGSTDGTRDVIVDFTRRDGRFKLIDSPVRSYGAQMNLGLDAARGEYIGIVEPDDWVETEMFATLLAAAERDSLDYVKADFIRFTGEGSSRSETHVRLLEGLDVPYGQLLDPKTFPELVTTMPATWAGVYRRDFLTRIGFRYNETPGASFQDTGLHLATVMQATRCCYLPSPLYHYRRGNAQASTFRPDAYEALCREFALLEKGLFPRIDAVCLERFRPDLRIARFKAERAAADRLSGAARDEVLEKMRERYSEDFRAGHFSRERMRPGDWLALVALVDGPGAVSVWDRVCACYRENGFWYTFCRVCWRRRGKELHG